MKFYVLLAILLGRMLTPFANRTSDQAVAQANIYYELLQRRGFIAETKMRNVQNLTSKRNVKVIVHGYLANRNHYSIVPIKNAYLSQGTDNVFMADWQKAAAFNYKTSRNLVSKVGLRFAKIISDFLTKHEIDTNEVHLIGHSLGAHVVGVIGRYFNGTMGRITGLDPARPLFTPGSNDSLGRSDAKFVDVIHTDIPAFGDQAPRGHADFYPNSGLLPQPGCSSADRRSLTICSHIRAVLLYAESIDMPKNFPSIPCSLQDIRLHFMHWCARVATLNTTVMMGEQVERSAHGQYYLETYAEPPYGMGHFRMSTGELSLSRNRSVEVRFTGTDTCWILEYIQWNGLGRRRYGVSETHTEV